MAGAEKPTGPSLQENLSGYRTDVLAEGRKTRRHLFLAFGLVALVFYGSIFFALNAVYGRLWF